MVHDLQFVDYQKSERADIVEDRKGPFSPLADIFATHKNA